jgi:cytochrome c553
MKLTFASLILLCLPAVAGVETGAQIYDRLCAECHGKKGEGVAGKYDDPLYGERSLRALAKYIDRTMPEDAADKLDAEGSQRVAEFIYQAFYSPEARLRNHPPKREPARLTNRQFRESVADLIGSFRPPTPPAEGVGLRGEYYGSDGMNKKARRAFERVDTVMDFDFGENAPGDGMPREQFSIAWNGSLIAPETGVYEFRIKTPNGARLYLNADLSAGDRNSRDDSDAKREATLIDGWVSSGSEVREITGSIFLLGGRRYPLRLDYFKYKDKRGAVRLEWKPPHGTWEVLRAPDIVPAGASRVAVVTAAFPADDRSAGYERGASVSKEWHEATTKAAIEAANEITGRLGRLADLRREDKDPTEKLKAFTATLAARAFRRPLTDEQRALYVERHFAPGLAPEIAVKRAALAILKSPRFLFPEFGVPADDHATAARLALALWDSLPDAALAEAAAKGELRTPEQIRAQAERMAADPRMQAKLLEFFDSWLSVDEGHDVQKDPKAFPGFDEHIVADLRRSLELFVEHIVTSDTADYRELLTADYLYLNERLAKFYGAQVEGPGFQRVALDPGQRAGVITHPFLLSTFAYAKASSPIHRGVFLTRKVLGRMLKPPPQAIEFKDEHLDPKLTMREKITELTKKETCMGCHATINPLGFSLEAFDAVGRFRTTENAKPVNVEADYTTADGEVLKFRGARDLAAHTIASDDARRGFVRHLFHHLIKNEPAAYGADTLSRLDETFAQSGTHIRKLAVEIAVAAAQPAAEKPTASR